MKKSLFIAATALLALASCTQTEQVQLPDEAITFQVAQYSARTKANVDGSGTKKFLDTGNTSFGVYAYYNTGAWDESGTINSVYMNNVEVLHGNKDTADDWAPASPYYWPKTGKLTFAGYAPKSANGTFTKADGIKFTGFTVATAPSTTAGSGNKTDLLYSDIAKDKTANETTYGHQGVPMVFRHALAKLNFEIFYDDSKLTNAMKLIITGTTVKSLKINNIYTSGNFKAILGENEKNWSGQGDAISTPVPLNSTATTIESTDDEHTTEGYVADYFVMPQTLSNEEGAWNIEVTYTINPSTEEIVATLPLYVKDSIEEWDANKVYTYTLKITPVGDLILFDPTVADWATGGSEIIEVPDAPEVAPEAPAED